MDRPTQKQRIDVLRPTILIDGVKYINKRDYDVLVQRNQFLLRQAQQQGRGLLRRKHQMHWDNAFKHKLYHHDVALYDRIMEEMKQLPPDRLTGECHVCRSAKNHLRKNRMEGASTNEVRDV